MCKYCDKIDDLSLLVFKNVKCGALGEHEAFLSLDGENGYMWFGFGESEFKKKINYCPMCGRKFEREE